MGSLAISYPRQPQRVGGTIGSNLWRYPIRGNHGFADTIFPPCVVIRFRRCGIPYLNHSSFFLHILFFFVIVSLCLRIISPTTAP
jgi:hypothetical protein